MLLTDEQKNDLYQSVKLLAELDEPEALLITLAKFAERRGRDNSLPSGDARRWARMADKLKEVAHADEGTQAAEDHGDGG